VAGAARAPRAVSLANREILPPHFSKSDNNPFT